MSIMTNESTMEDHIKKLEIEKDSQILDFGCGEGKYSILFAKLLGNKGKLFALDESESKLEELRKKIIQNGLEKRIHIIHTDGELKIPLKNVIIDYALLYNVACCIHGKENQDDLVRIVRDVFRITKDSGKLIINVLGKTMEKRIDAAVPLIQDYFILKEKESKKFFLDNNRARYRFFYYFLKKSENKV